MSQPNKNGENAEEYPKNKPIKKESDDFSVDEGISARSIRPSTRAQSSRITTVPSIVPSAIGTSNDKITITIRTNQTDQPLQSSSPSTSRHKSSKQLKKNRKQLFTSASHKSSDSKSSDPKKTSDHRHKHLKHKQDKPKSRLEATSEAFNEFKKKYKKMSAVNEKKTKKALNVFYQPPEETTLGTTQEQTVQPSVSIQSADLNATQVQTIPETEVSQTNNNFGIPQDYLAESTFTLASFVKTESLPAGKLVNKVNAMETRQSQSTTGNMKKNNDAKNLNDNDSSFHYYYRPSSRLGRHSTSFLATNQSVLFGNRVNPYGTVGMYPQRRQESTPLAISSGDRKNVANSTSLSNQLPGLNFYRDLLYPSSPSVIETPIAGCGGNTPHTVKPSNNSAFTSLGNPVLGTDVPKESTIWVKGIAVTPFLLNDVFAKLGKIVSVCLDQDNLDTTVIKYRNTYHP